MNGQRASYIERELLARGFGGTCVRVAGGVATLSVGLPDTPDAREALLAAFVGEGPSRAHQPAEASREVPGACWE